MGGMSSKYIMHDCRMPLWTSYHVQYEHSVPCTICNIQKHAKIYSSIDTNIAEPELCLSSSYSIHRRDWNECQYTSTLDRYFSLLENSSLLFYLESHNGKLGKGATRGFLPQACARLWKSQWLLSANPSCPLHTSFPSDGRWRSPNKSLSSSHSGREESLRPLRGYCWARLLHKLITFFMKEEIHMECNQVTY